jgi:hypothetical protein
MAGHSRDNPLDHVVVMGRAAEQALHVVHNFLAIQFPQLHPGAAT